MTLGQSIKSLRQRKGLSQPDLAEKAGIEQSYLSKLENDKSIPSSELLSQVLNALETTPQAFLALLDWQTERRKIEQISLLAQEFQGVAQRDLEKRRNILQIAIVAIVLAVGSFYTGYAKQLFGERVFLYVSDGVVFEHEPDDIFDRWHQWIPRDAENHNKLMEQKKNEMKLREVQASAMHHEYLGPQFTKQVDTGRRVFRMQKEMQVARPINAWLQTLGVMLFTAGILGLWFEHRMRKWRDQ